MSDDGDADESAAAAGGGGEQEQEAEAGEEAPTRADLAARAGPLQAMSPMIPKRAMVSSKHKRELPKTKQAQDRSPKCRALTPPAPGGGRGADKSRQRVGWEGGVQDRSDRPRAKAVVELQGCRSRRSWGCSNKKESGFGVLV